MLFQSGTFPCHQVRPYHCGRQCGLELACGNHTCSYCVSDWNFPMSPGATIPVWKTVWSRTSLWQSYMFIHIVFQTGTFPCHQVRPYQCGRQCGLELACGNHTCSFILCFRQELSHVTRCDHTNVVDSVV